jgi:hypothetical protein
MATSAITALASLTLATTQATVTFSSISGAYRDLYLVINNTNTASAANLRMTVNSDSGANYPYIVMEGDGASVVATSNTALNYLLIGVSQTTATMQRIQIMDYSATDKHKSVLIRSDYPAGATDAIAVRWANTAAITSLVVFPGASSFAAGSTFTLYGVSA